MAKYDACIRVALEAANEILSQEDAEAIVKEQAEKITKAVSLEDLLEPDEISGVRDAAFAYATLRQVQKRAERFRDLDLLSPELGEVGALKAQLVSSNTLNKLARDSVAVSVDSLRNNYLGKLYEIDAREGISELLQDSSIRTKVLQSYSELYENGGKFVGEGVGSPGLNEFVRALYNSSEEMRLQYLREGAFIDPENSMWMFGDHLADPQKVRKLGEAQFIDFMNRLADTEGALDLKSLDRKIQHHRDLKGLDESEQRAGYFKKVFRRLATGEGDDLDFHEIDLDNLSVSRYNNEAARRLVIPTVPLKSAQAVATFFEQLGTERVNELFYSSVDRSAASLGVMRKLGAAPEKMLDDMIAYLSKGKPEVRKELEYQLFDAVQSKTEGASGLTKATEYTKAGVKYFLEPSAKDILAVLTRKVNNTRDHSLASAAGAMRNFYSMTSLGFVSLLKPVEFAVESTLLNRFLGGGFNSFIEPWKSMLGFVKDPSQQDLIRYGALRAGMDTVLRNLVASVALETDTAGAMGKMTNQFFRINRLQPVETFQRKGAAAAISNTLAEWAEGRVSVGKGLEKEDLLLLNAYGIEEKDLANLPVRQLDGDKFIDYDLIEDYDLRIKMVGFINDMVNDVMVAPGVQTEAWKTRGFERGTLARTALDMMTHLKSYSYTMGTRVAPRMYYQEGAGGVAIAFAQMFTTAALTEALRDMSKGQEPTFDTRRVLLRSGMGGLYTDMLFGEYNKYGLGLGSIFGPTGATIEKGLKGLGQVTSGDFQGGLLEWSKLAFHQKLIFAPFLNTPVVRNTFFTTNLPFIKAIYDRMITATILDAIAPGYQNRLEQRLASEGKETLF